MTDSATLSTQISADPPAAGQCGSGLNARWLRALAAGLALFTVGASGGPRMLGATIGEPEVARVAFTDRGAGIVLVTFADDGAPTGPPAGRYGLVVNATTGCADDVRVRPYNPHHRASAPGVLPALVVVDVPGPDGGLVGSTRYAHAVRGLALRGPDSIAGHDLLLLAKPSMRADVQACTTIGE